MLQPHHLLAPGIMGTSMLQRALVSGGLNLLGQLAQEGSEGDFNALSVALASGIRCVVYSRNEQITMSGGRGMTTPSAADFL